MDKFHLMYGSLKRWPENVCMSNVGLETVPWEILLVTNSLIGDMKYWRARYKTIPPSPSPAPRCVERRVGREWLLSGRAKYSDVYIIPKINIQMAVIALWKHRRACDMNPRMFSFRKRSVGPCPMLDIIIPGCGTIV